MIFGNTSTQVFNDFFKTIVGKINADGSVASSNLPGMTCTRTSTGVYEISGTFPYDDYAIANLPIGDDNHDPCMAYTNFTETLSTGFIMYVYNSSQVLSNRPFSFMINFFD